MQSRHYPLSSEDCELLLAFETAPSLATLAKLQRKDVSVLSRHLKRIATASPVLEKIQGRWRLTALGRELNRWTQESMAEQSALLHGRHSLRVGATRTFAAKALAGGLDFLRERDATVAVSLISVETGIERSLLDGEIDVAFACGKPTSPAVAFARCAPERYVAAASPRFLKRYRLTDETSLRHAPHLMLSTPAFPYPFPEIAGVVGEVHAVFNDILCTIEAALADKGWGVFPWYAVHAAVGSGALVTLPFLALNEEIYGVWWLRDRKSLRPWAELCHQYLQRLRLA